jgi:hypothetical protein
LSDLDESQQTNVWCKNEVEKPTEPSGDLNEKDAELKAPRPKPLAEVAKEHGGDAGKVGKEMSGNDASPIAPARSSEAGGNGDGVQRKSHGQGTGEIYIKSTGLKADGGDFDAARAGAGKEADSEQPTSHFNITERFDKC